MITTTKLSVAGGLMGAAIGLALIVAAPAASAAEVTGLWSAPGGTMEIRACGESVCGHIVSAPGIVKNPDLRDVANKDPAQRGRLMKGLLVMSGFKRSSDGWVGGTIYNPNDGATYASSLKLISANSLKVAGCVAVVICLTQTWTRK